MKGKVIPLAGNRGDSIVSVERALHILERLADSVDGLTFTQIVALLKVNKAIACKLLDTLQRSAYVFRNDRTGNYCLTYRVNNLGLRKLGTARLLDQSSAVLRPLAERVGELVRLAVVEGGERITWVLSLLPHSQELQIDPNYSLEIGLHTHAAGKAWLATMPIEKASRLVRARGMAPMTRYSLTRMEDLRAELTRTRRRGYAISFEEHAVGVGAVGVAVLANGLDGVPRCVGVLTLAAPCARLSRETLEARAPLVQAAASRLGELWPIDASDAAEPPAGVTHSAAS